MQYAIYLLLISASFPLLCESLSSFVIVCQTLWSCWTHFFLLWIIPSLGIQSIKGPVTWPCLTKLPRMKSKVARGKLRISEDMMMQDSSVRLKTVSKQGMANLLDLAYQKFRKCLIWLCWHVSHTQTKEKQFQFWPRPLPIQAVLNNCTVLSVGECWHVTPIVMFHLWHMCCRFTITDLKAWGNWQNVEHLGEIHWGRFPPPHVPVLASMKPMNAFLFSSKKPVGQLHLVNYN